MKNNKLFGTIALAALVGLLLTACGEKETGDSIGPAFLGATLNLSGQVWTRDDVQFKGDRQVTAGFYFYNSEEDAEEFIPLGRNGSITKGKFSYSIGVPVQLAPINTFLMSFLDFFSFYERYNNINISDSNAKYAYVMYFDNLFKYYEGGSTKQEVADYGCYIYVDRDVSITAKGGTYDNFCDCGDFESVCYCEEYEGSCYCGEGTGTFTDIKLNFKEGWNSFCLKYTGTINSETITISAGIPSRTKWTLFYEHSEEED